MFFMKQEKLGTLFIAVCFCFALYAFGEMVFSANGPSYGDEQVKGFSALAYYREDPAALKVEVFAGEGAPGEDVWLSTNAEQVEFLLDALCTGVVWDEERHSYRSLGTSGSDREGAITDGLNTGQPAAHADIRIYDSGYMDGYFTIRIYPTAYWESEAVTPPFAEPFIASRDTQRRPNKYGGNKYIRSQYIAFQQEYADQIYHAIVEWAADAA